jgi:hypothetical protein
MYLGVYTDENEGYVITIFIEAENQMVASNKFREYLSDLECDIEGEFNDTLRVRPFNKIFTFK